MRTGRVKHVSLLLSCHGHSLAVEFRIGRGVREDTVKGYAILAQQQGVLEYHPWEIIISDINRILRELHIAISAAFLANKSLVIAPHEHDLFEEIWSKLNTEEKQETRQSYDHPNEQLEKNLEQIIIQYCNHLHLSRETITSTTTILLEHIIKLYHGLAAKRALLLEFEMNDHVLTISTLLHDLQNKQNQFVERYLKLKTKTHGVDAELENFEYVLEEIVRTLAQKGYCQIDGAISSHRIINHPDENLQSVRKCLQDLPDIAPIHQAIKQLSGYKLNLRQRNMLLIINQIQQYAQTIQHTITVSNQFVASFAQTTDNKIKNLAQECDYLQMVLSELHNDYLKRLLKRVSNIASYDGENELELESQNSLQRMMNETIVACKNQIYLSFTNLIITNPWHKVIEKLNTIKTITNNINELVSPYIPYLDEKETLQLRIDANKKQMHELNAEQKKLCARFVKVKNDWNRCNNILTNVQNDLIEHSSSMMDYIQTFIIHHWGKILIGSAIGMGCGILLAVLTTFNPISLVVFCICGAMIGFSIGASVGLGMDYVEEKNKRAKTLLPPYDSCIAMFFSKHARNISMMQQNDKHDKTKRL